MQKKCPHCNEYAEDCAPMQVVNIPFPMNYTYAVTSSNGFWIYEETGIERHFREEAELSKLGATRV